MAIQEEISEPFAQKSRNDTKEGVLGLLPKVSGRKRELPHTARRCCTSSVDSYNHNVVGAIRSRDVAQLRELLIDDHQDFNACNLNGEYLIHLACRRGDLKTIQFFILEAEVDVHVTDKMGRSILHDACWRPKFEADIWDFLLQVIDPKYLWMKDVRGHTPIDYVRKGDWPCWKSFLTRNRDLIKRRMMKSSPPKRDVELDRNTLGPTPPCICS